MEETVSQRGTKRKRYEPPPQDLSVKIQGKLHHSLKEVKKSAKKAKTFETQKFIKRLKDLRKKSGNTEEVEETERQMRLLKEIDHELVATTALRKKLNKLRILGENEHIQAVVSKEFGADITPAIPGTSAAKVQSRLLSSKILATEVAAVVNDLKNVIQPPAETVDDEVSTKQTRSMKMEEKVPNTTVESSAFNGSMESEQEPTGDDGLDDDGWESGTVDGDEAEARDGWESGSLSKDEDDNWDSAEESDDDEEELAVPPPKKSKLTAESKKAAKSTEMHSTFLPALSVGFTRGDSDDSDLSESEVKVADIDIKKNRRGQRARRAIWEKKFGKNANHKKKEALDIATRRLPNHRPKTSTRQPSATNVVPQYRQEVDAGWGQRTAAAGSLAHVPVARGKMKGRGEEKSIHPSWEAKRKLKEKESAGIVPSQGKKIKF